MPRTKRPWPVDSSLADALKQLGHVSPRRIRMNPAPGTATEKDVIRIQTRTDRLYELVDGILVEKVMGYPEAHLAMFLGRQLGNFAEDEHDLGIVSGADSTLRLMPRLIRIPDVCFVSWDQLPTREVPSEPIPDLAPDLAVEILSEGNTKGEMARKLKDYFLAGVRLVWYVYPDKRTVEVYTAPDQCTRLDINDTLDGGDVLPGFRLPLKKLFARVGKERLPARKPSKKNGKRRS
jgi:Uma2 family endonuclease